MRNHDKKDKKKTDLPDELIWISHIIMGLFFIYVGYSVLVRKQLAPYISVSVVVLGALAILYHSHLWYIDGQRETAKT